MLLKNFQDKSTLRFLNSWIIISSMLEKITPGFYVTKKMFQRADPTYTGAKLFIFYSIQHECSVCVCVCVACDTSIYGLG